MSPECERRAWGERRKQRTDLSLEQPGHLLDAKAQSSDGQTRIALCLAPSSFLLDLLLGLSLAVGGAVGRLERGRGRMVGCPCEDGRGQVRGREARVVVKRVVWRKSTYVCQSLRTTRGQLPMS